MTAQGSSSPQTGRDSESHRPTDTPEVRVECYVRAATPSSSVLDTLDHLHGLSAGGRIDDLTVTAWPKAVALTDHFTETDVVETFDRFEAWADQWNVDLRPPFAVEDRRTDFLDNDTQVLITPSLCLAVYAEGALAGVFPHASGDEVVGVEAAIEAITAGEVVANGAERMPAEPPAEREACPVCGSHLINGQGLYHCPDCDRTVVATPNGNFASSPTRTGGAESVDPQTPPAE